MKPTLSAIKQIELETRKIEGVISLAQGIPGLSPDKVIHDAAIHAIQQYEVDRYSLSAGLPKLREELSSFFGKDGFHYKPDSEIIVTVGAIEAISSIALALLNPDDEVITFTPTYYANYRNIVSLAKGIMKPIPLIENNNWQIDFDLLRNTISAKTKLLILCNPNNPTGSIIPKEDLFRLGDLAVKHKFIIVLDDVYHDLYFGEKPYVIAENKKHRNHVLRIVSFSKIFAMCGWRIAALHGPEKLIEKILPVHDILVNCAPVVSQYAVLEGLKHYDRITEKARITYRKHRDFVVRELDKMTSHFEFSIPDGAYYIFPKLKKTSDDESFCMNLLRKAKVALVPGSDFGPGGASHVRICFGRSMEELEEGMRRVQKYFG